jgi:hypothetical protein
MSHPVQPCPTKGTYHGQPVLFTGPDQSLTQSAGHADIEAAGVDAPSMIAVSS